MRNISDDLFIIECDRDYRDIVEFRDDMRISKKLFSKLYRSRSIYVNGEFLRKSLAIKKGDRVSFVLDDEEVSQVKGEKMDLDIVYEDKDLLLVNKPAFMPVHTTSYHQSSTLSNGLAYYFEANGIRRKIRIVNRLDENTSGLVLVAKSQHVDHQLSLQFREREVDKTYLALVDGVVESDKGIIEEKICSDMGTKKYIGDEGKYALSYYTVLERFRHNSLLEVRIATGRSHQIRLHLSHIGHSISGDRLYGSEMDLPRYMLHSSYLGFKHPRSNEYMSFSSELPKDMLGLMKTMDKL